MRYQYYTSTLIFCLIFNGDEDVSSRFEKGNFIFCNINHYLLTYHWIDFLKRQTMMLSKGFYDIPGQIGYLSKITILLSLPVGIPDKVGVDNKLNFTIIFFTFPFKTR